MQILKNYLSQTNQTPAGFARVCEMNKGNLSKAMNLKKKPTVNMMLKIHSGSGGVVTPNDLLEPWLQQTDKTQTNRKNNEH